MTVGNNLNHAMVVHEYDTKGIITKTLLCNFRRIGK